MNNVVIGRYLPGNGVLHRMDPRTKLLGLVFLLASVFLIDRFFHMLLALGLIIVLLLVSRISPKRVYLGMRPILFLLLFTFIFQIAFNEEGDLLWSLPLNWSLSSLAAVVAIVFLWGFTRRYVRFSLLYFLLGAAAVLTALANLDYGYTLTTGTLEVYEDGLQSAFFIMFRLIVIVAISTMVTMSTKPTDLNLGLEYILKPFKILRVNTEEIAMIIAISLRYIPTLLDEANKIMLAQASRGVDFKEGRLKEKVTQIVSLLVPMFIISFQRSDDLANAMEARSFVPGAPRTKLHVLIWRRLDYVALVVIFALFLASLGARLV